MASEGISVGRKMAATRNTAGQPRDTSAAEVPSVFPSFKQEFVYLVIKILSWPNTGLFGIVKLFRDLREKEKTKEFGPTFARASRGQSSRLV